MFAKELPRFSIFDHLHKIEVVRRKRSAIRAICPVCGGNNFEITTSGKNTGRFVCYSGCTSAQIREAIAPLSEALENIGVKAHRGSGRSRNLRVVNTAKVYQPAPLPEGEIVLAELPETPEPLPVIQKGLNRQTTYQYSGDQWVLRTDYYNEAGERTHKTTKPWHIADGKNVNSKGEKMWPIYRLPEAEQFAVGKWVLGVEGEKSVEAARFLQICSITWMGSAWSDFDLEAGLTSLKDAGVTGLIYLPDNDPPGEKKAFAIAHAAAKIQFPCLILNPLELWEEMPEKGDIADWVLGNRDWSREEFIEKMNRLIGATADSFSQRLAEYSFGGDGGDGTPIIESWCESEFSDLIAEKYREQLAYDIHQQQWLRYSADIEGIWGHETSDAVELICETEIKVYKYQFADSQGRPHPVSQRFCAGVERKLRAKLAVKEWNEISGLIPLTNGVLNPQTFELTPHCPGNRLTWCLPYPYLAIATCTPIEEWFKSQVGDEGTIEVLRAYLYAITTGKYEWQQYLEIIGKGGTGKGTFTRLAQALVGFHNTHSTKLQKLEGSNFESSSLKGKRLCVITDSERFAGEVSILKAATGSDLLPYERKFQQSTSGFIFEGMVLVAANESISSADYTSGLERRRITVRFDKQVERKNQRTLLDFRGTGEMFGEFAEYIPGLLNWVLAIGETRAKELLRNHCEASDTLNREKALMLTETNPLAAWADEALVEEPGFKNYVGIAQQIRYTNGDNGQSESWTGYRNVDTWLYPNYCQYAEHTGTKPLSQKRFTSLLVDLLQAQLKLVIAKGTDRRGSYFSGIKLRDSSDDDKPLLITKMFDSTPETVESHTETAECDGSCDGSVMGNVMAEAHVEQACDGCDAKIGNSLVPNESNRNTLSNSNDTVSEDKLASDPSQPLTPEITQTPETQAVIEVEELSEDETLPSPAITPEIVDVDVKESVIAERNKTFPIGSWVRYFDPMSRGFKGELAQVTALHEWSPKHIYVDGQNVFGNVRHAHCKPVSKNECLKLGLSNKLKK
jgi:putative DNA primase/helicase